MKAFWIALLAGFVALNAHALATSDIAALWNYISNPEPWDLVALADLLIALTIAVVWMWRDAATRQVNALPYTVLTICTGSIGVLVYLIRFWNRPAIKAPVRKPLTPASQKNP